MNFYEFFILIFKKLSRGYPNKFELRPQYSLRYFQKILFFFYRCGVVVAYRSSKAAGEVRALSPVAADLVYF